MSRAFWILFGVVALGVGLWGGRDTPTMRQRREWWR